VLDPVELARLLSGIAVVIDAPARELNDELEWLIPEAYRCTHGMARVYLPEIRLGHPTDFRRHRFFLDRDVTALGHEVVRDLIVEALARRFVTSAQHSIGSISDIEQLEHREEIKRVIEQARQDGQDNAFIEYCTGEVKRLENEAETLKFNIETATERADQLETTVRTEEFLRREADRRAEAAEVNAMRLEKVADMIAEYGLPVTSLSEAVAAIEGLFPDKVVFTVDAKRTAESAEFNSLRREMPQAVRLLWHIATTLHDLLYRDTDEPGRIVDRFKQRSGGFEMTMTEGSMTNRDAKAASARRVQFNGESIDISAHLKYGPIQNKWLRVHFGRPSDSSNQLIVVGHCGDHLDTAGTRRRGH